MQIYRQIGWREVFSLSDCRCVEKKKCEYKIDKLRENLQYINARNEDICLMEEKLKDLTLYNNNAFDNPEMAVLNNNIRWINEDLIEFKKNLEEKIQSKISDLKAKFAELKAEDDDYHTTHDAVTTQAN